MELKNANPNGDNVVASNLINVNFFFLKILNIEFKNEHHMLFFSKKCHDYPKNKIPISFTLQINIE
jgi:hypothetical protein